MTYIEQQLAQLNTDAFTNAVKNIHRGIERESLRVNQDGRLAQTDHPIGLGSALSNSYITTDYSEALLELITPPSNDIHETYGQLKDVHKFVLDNINGELLWPMSMPCFINDEEDIRIAQYGSSNVGKMKTTYRVGLKNRYGSMMQAISGIHYNFSMPSQFFKLLQELEGNTQESTEYQSARYMRMVRNIKRYVWVVTYLFGASPAMCGSFLQGRETGFNFQKFGKGSIFLPNATSLRMSDLGYTNSAQSALEIQYGSLTQYIEKLRKAIHTESQEYKNIGVKVDGEYKQLNHNILQIENELYAPVRPKQVAESGEKPTDALENRGVMYIELRALDVNPFSPYGITLDQMRVLDLFLLYCLFAEDDEMTSKQQQEAEENQDTVVLSGREKDLELNYNGKAIKRTSWLAEIYADMENIASWLDTHYGSKGYTESLDTIKPSIDDPEQTLSGKWMSELLTQEIDNGFFGMNLAKQYADDIRQSEANYFTTEMLTKEAEQSLAKQTQVEQSDSVSYDDFLKEYFAK